MIFVINRSTASTSRNNLFTLCFRTKARQRFNLFQTYNALEATNLSSLVAARFTFPLITEVSTIEICLYSLHRKEAFTGLRKREKIDRSPCSFTRKRRFTSRTSQPSRKEKAAIFLTLLNARALVRALITRKFMRSKDAQCKTEE